MSLTRWIVYYLLFMSSLAKAHPVSFKGSRGLMGYHTPQLTHHQLNYSFKHWLAGGVHYFSLPAVSGANATFVTANFLLKRWNSRRLQANVYANLGLGVNGLKVAQDEESQKTDGMGLLQFDIEDRDYYFLLKRLQVGDHTLEQNTVRLGFTPYVEKFDGLHSWVIFEWQESRFNQDKKSTDLTPLLRVFYNNLLFEMGQSMKGISKFNYITHF